MQQQALHQAPAAIPIEQKAPALEALKVLAKPQVVSLGENAEARPLTDRGVVKNAFMATIPLSAAEAQGSYNFSYKGKDAARGAFSADGLHRAFTRSVQKDGSFQWDNDIAIHKEVVNGQALLHVVMYAPMESITVKVGGRAVTLNRAELEETVRGGGASLTPSGPRTPAATGSPGGTPALNQPRIEPSNPFPRPRSNFPGSEPPSSPDRRRDDRLQADAGDRQSRPTRLVTFQDGPKSADVVVDPSIVKKLQTCLTISGARNAHPTKAFADFSGAVKVFQDLKSDPERAALLKQYNAATGKTGGKPLQEIVAFYKGDAGALTDAIIGESNKKLMTSMRTFGGTPDEKVALNEQWATANGNPDSKLLAAFGYQEAKRKLKDPTPTVEQYVQKLLPEPPSPSDIRPESLPMSAPVPEIVQQRVAYLQQLFEDVLPYGPGEKHELLSEATVIEVFSAVPDDEQRVQLIKAFDEAQVKAGGSSLAKSLSMIAGNTKEIIASVVGPSSAAALTAIAASDGSGPKGKFDGVRLKTVAQDLAATPLKKELVQFGFLARVGEPSRGDSLDVMRYLDERMEMAAKDMVRVSEGNVLLLKKAVSRDIGEDGRLRLADEKSAIKVFESLHHDKARLALIDAVDAELKEEGAPSVLQSILNTGKDHTALLSAIVGNSAMEILKKIDDSDGAYVFSRPAVEELKKVVETLKEDPTRAKLAEFAYQVQKKRFWGNHATLSKYLDHLIKVEPMLKSDYSLP